MISIVIYKHLNTSRETYDILKVRFLVYITTIPWIIWNLHFVCFDCILVRLQTSLPSVCLLKKRNMKKKTWKERCKIFPEYFDGELLRIAYCGKSKNRLQFLCSYDFQYHHSLRLLLLHVNSFNYKGGSNNFHGLTIKTKRILTRLLQ